MPQQPLLIDGRDEPRFRGEEAGFDPRAGHIPGAVRYAYGRNLNAAGFMLPPDQVRRQFGGLLDSTPAEAATFYCRASVIACANILAQVHAGLPEGKLYVGSWSEWNRSDRPIETSV